MATSEEIYDYDMATGQRVLVKKQMTPADFDPSNYIVRRLDAPAPDGEKIPISLIMRKETPLDGSAPLMIYGYGAYGYAFDAGYASNRFSLVDRGFVYAIAHVRGGTDKGWRWYEDGKLSPQAQYLWRFHRRDAPSRRRALRASSQDRGPRRQRRRHADGRDRQSGAGALCRRRRQCAVRRRARHHARRDAAADAARVARMGRSDPRRRGLQDHSQLLALRQRASAKLSGDSRACRASPIPG